MTLTADTAGPAGNAITASSTLTGFTWNAASLSGGATATVQPNAYPAKWGASLTAENCASDYVVYPVGQPGAVGTAANIVAYNNLYAGSGTITPTGPCVATGGNPTVLFAFNTHAGYSVTTSPVLSWDGTQVAFMESNGASAELVILKVAAGGTGIGAPQTLTPVSTTSYRTCTAPCETIVPFTNTYDDTLSNPYYDYGSTGADAIYVGDDQGYLHKFTGVFLGTPIEASTGWPVPLGSNMVSSPVFDDTSGRAFVGDMGGVYYSVPSNGSAGAVYNTGSIGDAIADAPLVDSTTSQTFVFLTTRITGGGTCYPGSNVVYQFSTGFTGYPTLPGCTYAGTGGTGYYLYDGDFDNVYYQSGGTGNLYVVGNTGATSGANIYQLPLSGGNMTGASNQYTAGNALTTSGVHPWPSAVTDFCNGACTTTTSGCTGGGTCTAAGSTDYIFFSVYDPVNAKTGCTTGANGCILSFNVSMPNAIARSGTGQTFTAPASPGCWGTSGMVIDNDTAAGTTGGSEIYFVNLAGAAAGGPNGSTSSACAGGTTPTITAIQAQQANP